MKILYVAYYYPPVGSIGMLRNLKLIKYLSGKGYDITVLTSKNGTSQQMVDKSLGDLPNVNVISTNSLEIKLKESNNSKTLLKKKRNYILC